MNKTSSDFLNSLPPSLFSDVNKNANRDQQKSIRTLFTQEEFSSLFNHSHLASDDVLAKIFDFENRLRDELKKDFPEKEEYQRLYDKTVLPRVLQAKQAIVKKDLNFSIHAAAAKGKAFQAGIKALTSSAQNNPFIVNNGKSAHQVFLLPKLGTVLKKCTIKAAEEESNINALFDLLSKQAVVGTFEFSHLSVEKYGIKIPLKDKERGFSWNTPLSPLLRFALRGKLPFIESCALRQPRTEKKIVGGAKENYYQMKRETWLIIQLPGKAVEKIHFNELVHRYLKDLLPPGTLLGSSQTPFMSLEEHIDKETALCQALNYMPAMKEESSLKTYLTPDFCHPSQESAYKICEQFIWFYTDEQGIRQSVGFHTFHANFVQKKCMMNVQFFPIGIPAPFPPQKSQIDLALSVQFKEEVGSEVFLTPDLSHPAHKEAYETCEKFIWSYVDPMGLRHNVNFKTYHANLLEQKPMLYVQIQPNNYPYAPNHFRHALPTHHQILTAVSAPWKIISAEVKGIDTTINVLGMVEKMEVLDLSHIQAKPFIDEMILLSKLETKGKETVLKRLTDEAQFQAIMTAELQFLDLHNNNLGVQPEPNLQYEHFKDLQFTLPVTGKTKSFKDLMMDYLNGKFYPQTVIKFEENGKIISKPLRELPLLQQALDVNWKLVIFDTDDSLGEGNETRLCVHSSYKEHYIPLRSVLLETSSKTHPLSETVIQKLMHSDESDWRVKKWISKEDAPIYKHLSEEVRKHIKKQVAPLIENYQLSISRILDANANIQSIAKKFAENISNINLPQHAAIWKTLEQSLSLEQAFSTVDVRFNDTWETIAVRHHQDAGQLQLLNPDGLQEGNRIKIQYDLTSSSPDALEKRKKIAIQLFPRLTFLQQKALLERQQSRKEYLQKYQALSQSTLMEEELFKYLQNYLQQPTTPLSSEKRREFLDQLIQQKSHFLNEAQALTTFKNKICVECRPSYFNLAKAMYPLLADVEELNIAAYGLNAKTAIGWMGIKDAIKIVREKFGPNTQEGRLAQLVEERITAIQNPPIWVLMA